MAKEKRRKIYADKGIFRIVGSRDYFIDYWIGKKRRQEKVGPSLAVARKLLIQRKAEIQEGRWSDPRGERILFKDFSEEFISLHAEGMKSAGRYILSVKRLCRTFGEMELGKITRLDVEKFKAARAKEVKGSSVNRDLACLKCMFNKAIAWGKAQHNPVKGIPFFNEEEFKRTEFLTPEQANNLLLECRRSKNQDLYPIVITALHTGMRKGEIFNLKIDDLDFENRLIRVTQSKSGRQRQIPMTSFLVETLQKVIRKRASKKVQFLDRYVFPGLTGHRLTDVKKAFERARRDAGIPHFRFHDLRHTFATNQRLAGTDLTDLKDLLGHADLSMTMRYAHVTPRHKRQVMENFETFLNSERKASLETAAGATE